MTIGNGVDSLGIIHTQHNDTIISLIMSILHCYNYVVENSETPKYFKIRELTRLYGVSDKAVRNWIEKAKLGKLNLELTVLDGKTYIKDSFHNSAVLEQVVLRGKKYHNKRAVHLVTPSHAFYELYTLDQVVDIINSIEKYRETPVHYRYLGKGANYWEAYLRKLSEQANSYVTSTVDLLKFDETYLSSFFEQFNHINIIDIGVGNGLSAKEFIKFVYRTGKLRKYIGVDISQYLLDRTESNIRQWLDDSVTIQKLVKDLNYDSLKDVVPSDTCGEDASQTLNIFLALGGTMTNFRKPEQFFIPIQNAMHVNDLLITSSRLDSKRSRNYFDYDIPRDRSLLAFHDRYTLDLLSIDRSFYDVEQLFDEGLKCRQIRVRLKVNVTINFDAGKFKKQVKLHKGDLIVLIRMWQFNKDEIVEILRHAGLETLRSTQTQDQEFSLIIAKPSTSL